MYNFLKSSVLVIFLTLFASSFASAQEIRVIDNKGTIKTVQNNQVTTSATAPKESVIGDVWFDTAEPSILPKIYNDSDVWKIIDQDKVTTNDAAPEIKNIGDIWLDTSLTPNTLNVWDGNTWISSNSQFWSLQGNTGTDPATDFIGTLDTQDLVLKTDNIEKLRIFGTKRQVLINEAPTFNNHPLVIRANVNDVLAFQNSLGVPKWHWNLIDSGLNFVESNVADFVFFLETGGNIGINTNDPTERLDINGTLRIRNLNLITADNDILTTNSSGLIQKKKLLATEATNDLTLGTNGGLFYTIATEAVTTDEILDGTILAQDIGQNGATEGQALLYNATTNKWVPTTIFIPTVCERYPDTNTQTVAESTFTSINFGLGDFAPTASDYTVDATGITVVKSGLYKATYRVTSQVQNNTRVGGEFHLTKQGTVVNNTKAYTYQRNSLVDKSTVTMVKIVDLAVGDTIGVQGRVYESSLNGDDELKILQEGTMLTLEKIN
jgi:hypothetical protein